MNAKQYSDYEGIRALNVIKSINLSAIVPKENLILEETVLGRLATLEIDRKLWDSIVDPGRADAYAKYNFVDRYFTECVYSLRRVDSLCVPASSSRDVSIQVTHSSTLRDSVTENMQLDTSLSASSTDPTSGSSASATVSASYGITKMKEYVSENSKVTTTMEHMDFAAYDRDIVTWDLVKTVALYREDDGDICLIGLGDFFVASTRATYARKELDAAPAGAALLMETH